MEPGATTLVADQPPKRLYEVVARAAQCGMPVLCFTTMSPAQLRARYPYPLNEAKIVWITSAESEVETVEPRRLDFEFARLLSNFIHHRKRALVLLDGVEYLVLENGFEKVLKFLKKVSDQASIAGSNVFIPVNPSAFEERDFAVLSRHFPAISFEPPPKTARPLRERLFPTEGGYDAYIAHLQNIAAARPTLFFLDDIHCATQPTMDIVSYTARFVRKQPILFILSYRPSELGADGEGGPGRGGFKHLLWQLDREGAVERIELGQLDYRSVASFVRERYECTFSRRFFQQISIQSSGNPFYLEAILDMLEAEGDLRCDPDGQWRIEGAPPDLNALGLPAPIENMILPQIERLDSAARRVLDFASVIGTIFDFDLLRIALAVDEERLATTLERLVHRRLIEEISARQKSYRFQQVQIREVTYQRLSSQKLRIIHKRIGRAMEKLHPPDAYTVWPLIGYHYKRGEEYENALVYFFRAAEMARTKYRYDTMIRQLESASETLEEIDHEEVPPPQRGQYREMSFMVEAQIGEAWYLLGEWKEATSHFETALGQLPSALNSAIAEGVGRIHAHLAEMSIERTDWPRAGPGYMKCRRYGEIAESEALVAVATRGMGRVLIARGEYDGAKKQFALAEEQFQHAHAREELYFNTLDLAKLHYRRGEFAAAKKRASHVLAIVTENGNLIGQLRAHRLLAQLAQSGGDYGKALEHLDGAVALARKLRASRPLITGLIDAARLSLFIGSIPTAHNCFAHAKKSGAPLPEPAPYSIFHLTRALIALGEEEWSLASDRLREAYSALDGHHLPFELAQLFTTVCAYFSDLLWLDQEGGGGRGAEGEKREEELDIASALQPGISFDKPTVALEIVVGVLDALQPGAAMGEEAHHALLMAASTAAAGLFATIDARQWSRRMVVLYDRLSAPDTDTTLATAQSQSQLQS